MLSLCRNWEFVEEWTDAFRLGEGNAKKVTLPHCGREVPLHYARPEDYEMVCGYRRVLTLPEGSEGKRVFVQFDGAAHLAEVYLNGNKLAEHRSGYTAFRVELTGHLKKGENLLAVRLDSRESSDVPPFGNVIDYLTYAGLYREVWLDIRPENYIEDVFVSTPYSTAAQVEVKTSGRRGRIRLKIYDAKKRLLAQTEDDPGTITLSVPGAKPWSCEKPYLHTLVTELLDGSGKVSDRVETSFGFRTAEFRAGGFYLNGKKTFLRGLNRHQSYPYVGYAVPESLQREDARILKEELACNAVRTSHYPQSQYFIDECDRLGLLVFTEFPGWQHIGGDAWKEQALVNLREMILQYRNHPSIILWGVRINESVDDDEFYAKTNAIAHELDPTRATSGVRYLEKSHLLEDVYAFNDFSHNGKTPPVRPKKKVTPDTGKAFLISECNGHMYPTKPFDSWSRRQEHALRHARVQNGALADGEHAGCFGWCMFDYATHKDFGSGDRICYHGVLDSFRNPKLAAALYASQGEKKPVLEVGSSMDIGDYPAGQLGDVWVFSNADEIRLYKNDVYVTSFRESSMSALPHGPVLVDDTIGELLQSQEGFTGAKEKLLHECLTAAGKYGLNLPLGKLLKMGWCMFRYHMSFADGYALYGKYVGNWGGEATRWRFDAVKNGEVVSSVTRSPGSQLHLEAVPSAEALTGRDTYDMAAVRIRIADENGMTCPFAQLPVRLTLSGNAELVGPDVITAEGGMCGTYLRTVGTSGTADLTLRCEGLNPVTLHFTIREER